MDCGNGRPTLFETPLFAYTIFLGAVQFIAISLSVFRVEFSAALSAAVFALSGALAFFLARATRGPRASAREERREPRHAALKAAIYFLLAVAVCYYAPLFNLALSALDSSYDGNSYHLPPIERWREKGYIHWLSFNHDIGGWRVVLIELGNGFSKAAEVVGFLLSYLTGNVLGANVSSAVFLPLGVLASAALGELFGASARAALCAGLLFLLVPSVMQEFPTTYVDAPLAGAETAALGFLSAAALKIMRGTNARRAVAGLGIALGLAIGVKGTGVLVAGGSLTGLLVTHVLLSKDGAIFTRVRRALRDVVIAGVLCAAVGGYWYGRNFLHTGTPLYPIGVSIFGYSVFPGAALDKRVVEYAGLPIELRELSQPMRVLWTWLQVPGAWPESIRGYDSRRGGLGFLWALWCLPAVVAACARFARTFRAPRSRAALIAIAVGAAIFLFKPMPWWPRYTLSLYGIGLPCFALFIEECLKSRSVPGSVWCVAGIVWAVGEGLIALVFTLSIPSAFACRLDDGAVLYPRNFMGLRGPLACEALRSPEPVAFGECTPDCETFSGPLGYRLGERRVDYFSDALLSDPETSDERLRSGGVRWLFWDRRSPPAAAILRREAHREEAGEFAVLSRLGEP